jgi:hypothetical protein
MQRIIAVINDSIRRPGVECLPCDRVNLDYDRHREYADGEEHQATDLFEHPTPKYSTVDTPHIDVSIPSILRYFLDGSRRTYKIGDLLVKGRYLPLIAGQVGVAVVERRQSARPYVPLHEFCSFANAIAFPDQLASPDDLKRLANHIQEATGNRFELLRYNVKADHDPVDLGIARIMSFMADLELQAMHAMSQKQLLQTSAMLVKDGPLRYKNVRGRGFDYLQFRNVIGVSKTFRSSFPVGSGRRKKDVGAITSSLLMGERTPVFKSLEEGRHIGMWYLRMRQPERMSHPLQGIIKMECYAVDRVEEQAGLESDRVTNISSHLLRERNVTAYGADTRWATHLYPVYVAENFIKANLLSDIRFEALF